MSTGLNGASIALSLVSAVFFLVGCIGYSDQSQTIENVAWITSSKNDIDLYFGLQAAKISIDFGAYGTYADTLKYSSNTDCNGDFCDKCARDGQGALGLTIIALVFSIVVVGLSGALIASANKGMQIANTLISLISAAFSLIAVGLFMGECYNAINNEDDDDDGYDDDGVSISLKWGPGAILTILGMLMMWIVVVLQIAAACMAPSA